MTMKLKLDAQGHVVVVEGKPVYVHADGKEAPFDVRASLADAMAIGTAFGRSAFAAEKVTAPVDMLHAAFGKAFKVEGGRVVGYGPAGIPLYSRAKPGELADFDEALEQLVEKYPHRDQILKSADPKPASPPAAPKPSTGGQRLSRTQFEALTPDKRMAYARGGGQVVD